MSSEQSQIEVGGQAIRVDPAFFKGQVYDGRLTFSGARLRCWASHAASNKPPGRFVLMAAGKAAAEQAPTMASERAAGMAENGAAQFDIALEAMPLPLSARFDVYAVAADEPVATLLPKEEDYLLDRIAIANESDFSNVIQNPATRLKDEAQVLYGSIHALKRFPNNFWVNAGAVCVIAYRIIHNFKAEPEINDIFDSALKQALLWTDAVAPGARMRWMISMRLAGAYVALYRKQFERAKLHLDEIMQYAPALSTWPSSLTNILLANYGLAYLALHGGNKTLASEIWTRAEGIFRFGCSVAQFPNYYAYGELGNALKVAQESLVGRLVAASGLTIDNPSLAPPGTQLDPKRLPAPLGWLLPPLP